MMQRADMARVPFWPADSILDVPLIVLDWLAIKAEALARAEPAIARHQQANAKFARALAG
jgi:hypothetical protein